jgi:hypothetical protein
MTGAPFCGLVVVVDPPAVMVAPVDMAGDAMPWPETPPL